MLQPSVSLPQLNPAQNALVERLGSRSLFLEGPAGCGKTTCGAAYLARLLEAGVQPGEIMLSVPWRNPTNPYRAVGAYADKTSNQPVLPVTLAGLAQRMIVRFWEIAAGLSGFAYSDALPLFLTFETAQYYFARLARPLLDAGYFDGLTIIPSRLYAQILDDLNRSATTPFPVQEIGQRLRLARRGEPFPERIYDEVQALATRFRRFCLAHNFLDFSLQIEVFSKYLWPLPECQNYLKHTYKHLIADNLEEDTPVLHDLLLEWLPSFDSALLIFDHHGGFRTRLGADPESAYRLKDACQIHAGLSDPQVISSPVQALGAHLAEALLPGFAPPLDLRSGEAASFGPALEIGTHHFFPQMLDWAVEKIADLVNARGISPAEIAVLAPTLPDASLYALSSRLQALDIPVWARRPSRPLQAEPATRSLLTLARLAHPAWEEAPPRTDVTLALVQAIQGLDLVRAQLLVEIVYRAPDGRAALSSFNRLRLEARLRITEELGERYERLREWLVDYAQSPTAALDVFFNRLMEDVLAQPGFGFTSGEAAALAAANLIDSARNFRLAAEPVLAAEGLPVGREFIHIAAEGALPDQYLRDWETQPGQGILLAPVHTFLLTNQPVDYQFWLDVGSPAWIERISLPLAHPVVLGRNWPPDQPWTELDEQEAGREALYYQILGLVRRCRQGVYVGFCKMGQSGYEQRGLLQQVFERILTRASGSTGKRQE